MADNSPAPVLKTVATAMKPNSFAKFVEGNFGDAGKLFILTTAQEEGGTGKAFIAENSSGFSQRNVIEIQIDNSGGGAADQILRIGGLAATAGTAQLFGLAPGAADNGVIKDQYGTGVKFTQGLGLMTNKGVYIHDWQTISTVDNALQLQQPLIMRRIFFNGDNTPITLPAAVTFEMSDQRKNMMKDSNDTFFLNDLNFIEYTIKAGFVGSILFKIKGADLSALMNVIE